ncbi:hypothetical protein WJX81_006168 [Elliptochloris bilobata]|uniref:ATP-dependent DNA helicase n=1 Tax=Elliptochloris bilobata TaxID=381761 RepID=A0AAW1RNQ4_9CHLO
MARGFDKFKGKQQEAVLAALAGRDTLVLMPTGGGKSLCYALPPVQRGAVALVVTPLIALMQDQVANMRKKGVAAALLCSTLSAAERKAVLASLQAGEFRLLYVTPELLASGWFLEVLCGMAERGLLTLIAVDEAHCISSYGHDFRPAYRKLSALRRSLPAIPLMALTATATLKVQEDIVTSLRMRNPLRLTASFNRPNISYEVIYMTAARGEPLAALASIVRGAAAGMATPCGIIYTARREDAEAVAGRLRSEGLKAAPYHAGLSAAERARVLTDWSAGRMPLVAATIAFGMGVDKAGVRLVVHFNMPKTLEGYYQESGRAGRDGLPARSIMFYDIADRERTDFILGKGRDKKGGAKGGKRDRSSNGRESGPAEQAAAASAQADFAKVVNFCTAETCRRAMLLAHFGERLPPGRCTGCDVCSDPAAVAQQLSVVAREALGRAQAHTQRYGGWRARDGADQDRTAGSGWGSGSQGEGRCDIERECAEQAAERSAAGAAAAVAKRARAGPGSEAAVMDALEAAEQRCAQRSTGAAGRRAEKLLEKLASAAGRPVAASSRPGGAAVSESLRAAARQRLRAALGRSPAAAGAAGSSMDAAAQMREQECFAASVSAVVYRQLFGFHIQDNIGPALEWIDQHKVRGAVAFIAIYALATVLFLPGLLLSLGGGAAFGAALGCLVVWSGAVVGETMAFLLGRLLLRDWLKTLTRERPTWEAVDTAVAEEGWKMVLLLRLAPVVPFAALNYALGATSVGLWPYTWASAVGIVPGVVAFVYVGSVAGGIGEVLAGRARPPPGVAIAGAIASVVAIFATGALITVHARRAIQRRLHRVRPQDSQSVVALDVEAGRSDPARGLGLDDEAPEAPLLRC